MVVNKRIISFLIASLILTLNCSNGLAQEAEAAVIQKSPSNGYTIPSALTEDEKYWFVKFQEGNMFADGWQQISEMILEKTSPADLHKQKELLASLGKKIGLEWCKDNDTRKIDTSQLKAWGKILKNAAKKEPEMLGVVLASIDKEVDTLLN